MKIFRINLFLAVSLVYIFTTSCKKEDKEAPVITLNGDALITLNSGKYIEYGANAYDNKEGQLVPVITNLLDLNTLGTYKITYTAYDNNGNKASVVRLVTVFNYSKFLAGVYNVHQVNIDANGFPIDSSDYTQTMTASTKYNRNLSYSKFLNKSFYPPGTKVTGYFDMETRKINLETNPGSLSKVLYEYANLVANVSRNQVNHYFSGNGIVQPDSSFVIMAKDSIATYYQSYFIPSGLPAVWRTDSTLTSFKHFKLVMKR